MSTHAEIPAPRLARTLVSDWLVAATAATWTAVVVAGAAGFVERPRVMWLATLGAPLIAGAWLLLSDHRASATVRRAALWTGLISLSLATAPTFAAQPKFALAVPALALAGLAAYRWPLQVALLALAFSGTYNTVGAYTSIPVDSTADLLLAGMWAGALFGYVARRGGRRAVVLPGIAMIVLYMAVTAVAAFLSPDARVAFYGLRLSAWYATVVVLIAYAPWSSQTYHRLLRGAVGVSLLVAGYAVLRLVFPPGTAEIERASNYTGGLIYNQGELRLFGSFSGRHLLGAWTAVAVPFCAAAALALQGRWRVAATAAAVCGVIAMFGSDVRTAVAAVAIAGGVMVLLYELARGFPGLRIGAVSAVVVLTVALGAGSFFIATDGDTTRLQRYTTLTDPGSDPSIVARTFKWEQVLADASDRPLGHGIGTAGARSHEFSRLVTFQDVYIDNSYLTIAYEQGLPIMALFILALVTLLAGVARRAVLTPVPWEAAVGIASAGALVAYAVMLSTGPYLQELSAFFSWFVIGLGIAPLVQRLESPAEPSSLAADPDG